MQYRKDRYGEPISLLGYGCMRFTKNGNSIDLDKAERELMLAIKSGVNYLDTAYADRCCGMGETEEAWY